MARKRKEPSCWICKDLGLVVYRKKTNGISYEMAARCSCKQGMASSDRIPIIDSNLAEKLAIDNYKSLSS